MNSIFNRPKRCCITWQCLPYLLFVMFALVSNAVVAFPGIRQDSSPSNPVPDENLKAFGDLRRDLKAFMKNSKRDSEPEIKSAAILNLCQLHETLVADPRFQTQEAWQGLRIVAANRLKELAKQIDREQLRRTRNSKSGPENELPENELPASELPGNGLTAAGSHDDSDPFPDLESAGSDSSAEAYRMASLSYNSMGSFSGGPAMLFNYAGGHFGPDHGPELVALIENTINPNSWRRRGGTGAIEYFEPLRVLVITASAEVQQKSEELLAKLRFASQ